MKAGASIDPFNPKRAHVPFFGSSISVRILQCLLHPFSSYPYAVFCPAPESFCQLKYFVLVHLFFSMQTAHLHKTVNSTSVHIYSWNGWYVTNAVEVTVRNHMHLTIYPMFFKEKGTV